MIKDFEISAIIKEKQDLSKLTDAPFLTARLAINDVKLRHH